MQIASASDTAVSSSRTIRSKNGRFVAEFLPFSTNWMVGGIEGAALADLESREELARAVMDCIEVVDVGQLAYSTCTDGRYRIKLDDNSTPVPVREQLVGTDTMLAFVAAEALGERFYGTDTELYSSVTKRLYKVVDFMLENGLKPTAHVSCGAAGSFTGVMGKAMQFINSADYTARLQTLMPSGSYNSVIHHFIVGGYKSRLDSNVYEGYRDGLVADIIRERVGNDAVEHYLDDGRGVHGHREQAVMYLDESIKGLAINPNTLSDTFDGLQVFGVNAARMMQLAKLFSDGGRSVMDYTTALIAMHDFSAAGHGTLAYTMRTAIIRSTH